MTGHLLALLLGIAALLCFAGAALGAETRVNLTALGLACLTGALLAQWAGL